MVIGADVLGQVCEVREGAFGPVLVLAHDDALALVVLEHDREGDLD